MIRQACKSVVLQQTVDDSGRLVITIPGGVAVDINRPVASNDTAIKVARDALEIGAKMPDGTVFAGLTADGKHRIYVPPGGLGVRMTFNDAAKVVEKVNSEKFLGHDDWHIPSLENLRVLQKNQSEGRLRGTFTKKAQKGSPFPGWYWSSTEYRDHPSGVWVIQFSDGNVDWFRKDVFRLSCRPVRLVEASAPAPR